MIMCIFFFQAEDGIRDIGVTGVQTCALPILRPGRIGVLLMNLGTPEATDYWSMRRYLKEFLSDRRGIGNPRRTEEGRAGEEWRSRGGAEYKKKKNKDLTKQEPDSTQS